eukprot:CAMPEP_0170304790 /NCGR_PEP_ID=MMETSP0116_2-20130129/52745_1 /TAXON_ID=400756 /ORGANISM="Durinskia baltica, Strain CSIRO CS-38" /LENGTH=66 /DNA_ID=CAMNT_0010556793 /DNA_START=13 /DNA_END=213 /DNA_ORIENTATION=-
MNSADRGWHVGNWRHAKRKNAALNAIHTARACEMWVSSRPSPEIPLMHAAGQTRRVRRPSVRGRNP